MDLAATDSGASSPQPEYTADDLHKAKRAMAAEASGIDVPDDFDDPKARDMANLDLMLALADAHPQGFFTLRREILKMAETELKYVRALNANITLEQSGIVAQRASAAYGALMRVWESVTPGFMKQRLDKLARERSLSRRRSDAGRRAERAGRAGR